MIIDVFVGISCCVLLLTAFLWRKRARSRELRDLRTELAQWSNIPTDELGTLCSFDFTDDLAERTERVYNLLGPAGFAAIEQKTRSLVRILQSANIEHPGCLESEDLGYVAEKVTSLRLEIPPVALELLTRSTFKVTCLHAFRAACLYCQIVSCISDAAHASQSDTLLAIAAKL
jgi:hypothetical protein